MPLMGWVCSIFSCAHLVFTEFYLRNLIFRIYLSVNQWNSHPNICETLGFRSVQSAFFCETCMFAIYFLRINIRRTLPASKNLRTKYVRVCLLWTRKCAHHASCEHSCFTEIILRTLMVRKICCHFSKWFFVNQSSSQFFFVNEKLITNFFVNKKGFRGKKMRNWNIRKCFCAHIWLSQINFAKHFLFANR